MLAIEAGATGYLLKDSPRERILAAFEECDTPPWVPGLNDDMVGRFTETHHYQFRNVSTK